MLKNSTFSFFFSFVITWHLLSAFSSLSFFPLSSLYFRHTFFYFFTNTLSIISFTSKLGQFQQLQLRINGKVQVLKPREKLKTKWFHFFSPKFNFSHFHIFQLFTNIFRLFWHFNHFQLSSLKVTEKVTVPWNIQLVKSDLITIIWRYCLKVNHYVLMGRRRKKKNHEK